MLGWQWGGAGYISVDPEPDNDLLWVDEVAGDADTCLVAMNDIEVQGDAERLLPVLFPPQHPQMDNQAL